MDGKSYLSVAFEDKDLAKDLGAKWDGINKKWYVDRYAKLNKVFQWQPPKITYVEKALSEFEIVHKFKELRCRFQTPEEIISYLDIDISRVSFVSDGFCHMCDSDVRGEWMLNKQVELRHLKDLTPKELYMLEYYLQGNSLNKS